MKKFAVIFDMDGVLIDSNKIIWDSFNYLLKPKGIHFSDKDIKEYMGLSLRDQTVLWKKKYGIEIDYNKFSKDAGERELKLMSNMNPDKYLIRLLDELKSRNIKMGVGTSSQKWRADEILSLLKIKDYFSVIMTSEDVTNHKPNPDIFLKVAEKLGIVPENCVVIEDAASGIEAAKRGNMKAIGYLTQYYAKEELGKADLIISSFKDLNLRKLESLF